MSPQTLRERAEVRLEPEDGPEFQIAPMIDILLVLLVFFMSISSTEVLQRKNDVVLPVAQDEYSNRGGHGHAIINVTWSIIDNTGSVTIDGKTFTQAAQVRDYVRIKAQANPEMRVLFRADRDVRYDFMRTLMIAVGEAGIGKVEFAVVDRNLSPNPTR
jgi:biopolymer transport protein ExbD